MYYIDEEKCTGCEACMCVCPCGAIRKDENTGVCVIDTTICAECGACQDECPFDAIEERD